MDLLTYTMPRTALEIKIALMQRGVEIQEIAREVGCDPTVVSHAIAGRRRGPKARAALAAIEAHLRREPLEVAPSGA